MSKDYNRKDTYYEKAKENGYLSRAAYKLKELNKKFSLLKKGALVLDLGAAPGSWSQTALESIGEKGRVIAIDLVPIEGIKDARLTAIQGDLLDDSVIQKCVEILGSKADSVLSDMSPKLTGISELDQSQIVQCGHAAVEVSKRALKAGGSLVIKLFKGQDAEQFVKSLKPLFNKVTRVELETTRTTSNEFYVVGTQFKAEAATTEGKN